MASPRSPRFLAALLAAVCSGMPGLLAQGASPFVSGAWCGNVTPTSATVCIRLNAAGLSVRLGIGTLPALAPVAYSSAMITSAANGNVASLDITGLRPDTDYYYGIEVGGVLRTEAISRGRFHTFPQGAASFRFALVGDGDYRDADQSGYDAVVAEQPLLILFNGDLHYSDVSTTTPEDYRIPYDNTLKHANEGAFFRSAAMAYLWDDHDSAGGDNTNGDAVGLPTSRAVYRDYVPHYPLALPSVCVAQAFTVGRVRFIMTDLRSTSVSPNLPESPTKTMMGAAQKAWFKQELISARDAGFPLVAWVCPVPWISPPLLGDDSWGGYATERAEIADFIKANRIKNVVMLSGDMHAIAYDDGTHSDYATGGGAPLIVLHSAAISHSGGTKGGPYSGGPFPNSLQYGMVEVVDTGGSSILCRFTGKRVGEGIKLFYQFTASAAGIDAGVISPRDTTPVDRALVNISARGRIATAGDTLIAGFVIDGRTQRTILLRAVGPSLAAFSVNDPLARPTLTLFQGATVIASNDDWGLENPTRLTAAFDRAGAFRLQGAASHDAAMLLSLPPGAYTMRVRSADGGTGSVLAEAYEVP